MKKLAILTIGLVLGSLTAVDAQTQAKAKKTKTGAEYWSLGPIMGFGGSWMTGMNNQNFKPSGELGVGFIYSRREHWGFGADLTGSSEGYVAEYTMNGVKYTSNITPVYLRLTPKAYYFFGDYGDIVRPKIYLGPSVGVKLGEGQEVTTVTYTGGDIPKTLNPQGDVYRSMDFGVKFGAGANIQLAKSMWLNTDIGYYQGLVDVTGLNNMNTSLRLNLGLMFGL